MIDKQTALEYLAELTAWAQSQPDVVVLRPLTAYEFQQALDTAPEGSQIRLKPGAEYIANFDLKPRSLNELVTITTDRMLPDGRIDPTTELAIIRSPNTVSAMTAQPSSHHFAFLGTRFEANVNGEGDIVRVGRGVETDAATLPHTIYFDRIVMRGGPQGQKRGIAMNGNNLIIINSDIRDIWRNGQDNQCCGGWNTAGGHVIRNNRLESGGENVIFGGSQDPANVICKDIIIEDNDITRPIEWQTDGVNRTVKNLLELKMGVNVSIRRNRFSNHWPAAQPGWAIVFTPRNNNEIRDVYFEDNTLEAISMGINVAGSAYEGTNAYVPPFIGLSIKNNLFVIDKAKMGGTGWFLQIGGIETDEDSRYVVENNTILHDGNNLVSIYRGDYDDPNGISQKGKPLRGFTFRNNFSRTGIYGFWTESSYGGLWNAIPGGVIENNVLSGSRQASQLPGNFFPSEAEFQASFVDYLNGDYHLKPGMWPGLGRQNW